MSLKKKLETWRRRKRNLYNY